MKIRLKLEGGQHSRGRGVGFYRDHLLKALQETGQVEAVESDPDIIHYPFFDLFYPTLPLIKKTKTVVTIHDLTPLVLKKLYPKGIKGNLNLIRQRISLTNVSAYITDSQSSKKDLIKIFKLSPSKIFVTPLAVDEEFAKIPSPKFVNFVKNKYRLPGRFILAVAGGPNPNKNLPALAAAAEKIKVPLMIVGKGLLEEVSPPVHPELRDLVKLKSFKDLILPGFVETDELNAIYRLAAVYCQPSFYEGFGLPLLEAMTAGCLVTSANAGSLPEIYPPETITFSPYSQNEIEYSLRRALSLPPAQKQKLIKAGIEKARRFSWDKTARLTLAVYRNTLNPNTK